MDDDREWISCAESIPPRGMWVEMQRYKFDQQIKRACVKGWFRKRWEYPSGLSNWYVCETDIWRPIIDNKK